MATTLLADNEKLVTEFGANRISNLKEIPDFYTFKNNLIYSHRDFDKFLNALKKEEKCAIVSGFNASGTIHFGHKVVFDTNLYFQKKYGIPVFIPISDDESYVAGKVKTQEEALNNSLALAKELIAYGFDPKKTYFIIDQIYTNIYNLAIKLSKKINLSENVHV
jgi:tryptophanyl-tRNA synthetase